MTKKQGLAGLDLNLLITFQVLYEFRHVTKAAEQLNISQPALSHALKRLRRSLSDDLFVKTPKGMVPTDRAKSLAPFIQDILDRIEQNIIQGRVWDLATARKTFQIQSTDLIESLLVPSLIDSIHKEAPETSVAFTTARFSLPKDELESGASDLAIAGFFEDLPPGFYRQKVFSDTLQGAVRKGHPRITKGSKISIGDFCEESHLMIAPGGELSGKIDLVLAKQKKSRHVVVGLSTFMGSGSILQGTDSILVGPSRMIQKYSKELGLHVFDLPVEIPAIQIVQVWHERNHRDPHHRWLREQIRSILN